MNLELLNRVWKQIDSQPETWDQKNWLSQPEHCGTQACIAGWTVLLEGWEPSFTDDAIVTRSAEGDTVTATATVRRDGAEADVGTTAAELLGLSDQEAGYLFFPFRNIGDIQEFVDRANEGANPLPEHMRPDAADVYRW